MNGEDPRALSVASNHRKRKKEMLQRHTKSRRVCAAKEWMSVWEGRERGRRSGDGLRGSREGMRAEWVGGARRKDGGKGKARKAVRGATACAVR